MRNRIVEPARVVVPDTIEIAPTPRDFTSLAWSMLDKVAEGSTAVIFALILLWWFSRKTISGFITRFNNLMDTLSQTTRDNSYSQQQLAVTQEKLNETLKHMGDEDIRTATILGQMDSKLKHIRSMLLEVRSYQTGIPQNRMNYFDVLDAEDDSGLDN